MALVTFRFRFSAADGAQYEKGQTVDVGEEDAVRYVRNQIADPADGPHRARWDDKKVPPARNARKEAWEAFGILHGYDPDEGLSRDELVERYGEVAV